MGASLISNIAYGLYGEKYVTIAENFSSSIEKAAEYHALNLLVDWFPFCRCLFTEVSDHALTSSSPSGARPPLVSFYEKSSDMEKASITVLLTPKQRMAWEASVKGYMGNR